MKDKISNGSEDSQSFPDKGQSRKIGGKHKKLPESGSISRLKTESKATKSDRISSETSTDIESVPGYDKNILLTAMQTSSTQLEERPLLDAWYAEFGSPTLNALLLKQPDIAESAAKVVIGTDDRVRVNPTSSYPWRCICSLLITPQIGTQQYMGTGWLVSPRTIITAGHCVYIHNLGGWAKSIQVTPGRNGTSREDPFGSSFQDHLRSFNAWINNKDTNYDMGAIILPRDFTGFNSLGYFGYANVSDLQGMTANLSGYPGDKDALPGLRGTQWFHSRQIKQADSHRFYYDIDTAGGQSGSPVWRFLNGQRHVVGVHTNGESTGNSATRITSDIFDVIQRWKNWWS
jgi:glutamyl endopeptidase